MKDKEAALGFILAARRMDQGRSTMSFYADPPRRPTTQGHRTITRSQLLKIQLLKIATFYAAIWAAGLIWRILFCTNNCCLCNTSR